MTQSFHSTLNTYLLGLVSLLLAGVLALMGWGLSTIVSIGKEVSAQGRDVAGHTEQIAEVRREVEKVGEKFDKKSEALSVKMDAKTDELQHSIELALRDGKGLPSRQ